LRAFAQLETPVRHRLLILGEGGERDALLRLPRRLGIGELVTFPGRSPLVASSDGCQRER
jgi:hypothetical protein